MNLCYQCELRTFCESSTLIVGETTVCKNFIQDELLEIKKCKYCNREVEYGDMIWLNGKCMCPTCYKREKMGIGGVPE